MFQHFATFIFRRDFKIFAENIFIYFFRRQQRKNSTAATPALSRQRADKVKRQLSSCFAMQLFSNWRLQDFISYYRQPARNFTSLH